VRRLSSNMAVNIGQLRIEAVESGRQVSPCAPSVPAQKLFFWREASAGRFGFIGIAEWEPADL
jgi:hypothetical protein